MTFFGQDLRITSFTENSAVLSGRLQNIEFQVRGVDGDS